MRMSRLFIDRPIFAAVIAAVITLVGAISYFFLPVSQYPDIVPPTVTVNAVYPGASAETVADTVANPIEQEINGVDGMLYQSSESTGDGRMTITVTFKPGTDLDEAQVLVQNRVAIAEARAARGGSEARHRHAQDDARLPDGGEPRIARRLARSRLHLQLRADADQGSARPAGGCGRRAAVRPAGARHARLDRPRPRRDAGAHRQRCRPRAARAERAGRSGHGSASSRAPMPRSSSTSRRRGRFTDPAQFGQVVIRTDDQGRQVRVNDVARVEIRRGGLCHQRLSQRRQFGDSAGFPEARLQRASRRQRA